MASDLTRRCRESLSSYKKNTFLPEGSTVRLLVKEGNTTYTFRRSLEVLVLPFLTSSTPTCCHSAPTELSVPIAPSHQKMLVLPSLSGLVLQAFTQVSYIAVT
ncbi:hypothetical protein TNCV_954401 [Trichonephila clavipes]|nr:hypothetical protein TNCV_954401 [Trichonephila clavipes]